MINRVARKITKKLFNPHYTDTFSSYANIAILAHEIGNADIAKQAFKKAKAMSETDKEIEYIFFLSKYISASLTTNTNRNLSQTLSDHMKNLTLILEDIIPYSLQNLISSLYNMSLKQKIILTAIYYDIPFTLKTITTLWFVTLHIYNDVYQEDIISEIYDMSPNIIKKPISFVYNMSSKKQFVAAAILYHMSLNQKIIITVLIAMLSAYIQ